MTKNYMSGMLDSILAAKMKAASLKGAAEKKLQGLGRRIRKNVSQGQKDLKSGKINSSAYINPFKK